MPHVTLLASVGAAHTLAALHPNASSWTAQLNDQQQAIRSSTFLPTYSYELQ
jgi:hypothetical protein